MTAIVDIWKKQTAVGFNYTLQERGKRMKCESQTFPGYHGYLVSIIRYKNDCNSSGYINNSYRTAAVGF